jgi:hypothetical protein
LHVDRPELLDQNGVRRVSRGSDDLPYADEYRTDEQLTLEGNARRA